MRPHDVNHRVSSKFREIVGADHDIVVAAPYIIHTRFELDQVVHMRSTLRHPFHVANDPGAGSKFELAAVLGGRRIDACRSQALQMIVTLPWIYHMDGFIATLKSVLYEWPQHAVLFVVAVEKRADVTYLAQLGAGKGNRRHGLLHGV